MGPLVLLKQLLKNPWRVSDTRINVASDPITAFLRCVDRELENISDLNLILRYGEDKSEIPAVKEIETWNPLDSLKQLTRHADKTFNSSKRHHGWRRR